MDLQIGSLDITYGSDGGSPVPWNVRDGLLGQVQDGARSLSQTTPGVAAAEPSVVAGLRDRLLREARQERIRCLQVARASERWRADDGGTATAATTGDSTTQTDPVLINGPGAAGPVDASMADVWSQSDEDSQREAIRMIQSLSQKCTDTSSSDRRIAELEEMLRNERKGRLDLEASAAKEKQTREALQEQVLCLEQELDSKENVVQASERALERGTGLQRELRDNSPMRYTENGLGNRPMQTMPNLGSMPQASLGSSFRAASPFNQSSSFNHRLRAADNRNRSMSPNAVRMAASDETASLLAARRQLLERDQQLSQTQGGQQRDPQLSQLLRELRQSQDAPMSGFEQGFSGDAWRSPMARDMNQTAPSMSFGMHQR